MNIIVNGKPINRFTKRSATYQKDVRATATLNKVLGTDFLAVYRDVDDYYDSQWKSSRITPDCETFFILRKDGELVKVSNSEWLSIKIVN